MDLMEYKARELFVKYGLPSGVGVVGDSVEEILASRENITYPAVVKAQVAVGGRGKAGGIKFAENEEELVAACSAIFGMDIKGHTVRKIMVKPKDEIGRELYLSITLDRGARRPVILFCPEGGMEIEAHPEKVIKYPVDPTRGIPDYTARYLAGKAGLNNDQFKELYALLVKLYKLFREYDCMLCEINPLAIDAEGHLLCLDGKVSIDDSALKRLPDMQEYEKSAPREPMVAEAESFNFLLIPCSKEGNIGIMSNGSGMLMSCMDALAKRGMTTRTTLDLGGGATAERIKEAVRILLSDPKIEYLFINIFGGITRCDEVAGGIRLAKELYDIKQPMVIRFEGTNKDKGLEIINGLGNVTYVDGLLAGVEVLANEYSRQ